MSTTMTDRQMILLQTNAARDKAEALLRGLMQAKEEAERRLAEHDQRDPMAVVTGRSSLEQAIDATRKMIQTLNRRLAEARRDLHDADMAILDELDDLSDTLKHSDLSDLDIDVEHDTLSSRYA
jgi:hypothetical protein